MTAAQVLAKQWYYAKDKRRVQVKQLIANATVRIEPFGFDDERLHLKDGSMLLHRKMLNEYKS